MSETISVMSDDEMISLGLNPIAGIEMEDDGVDTGDLLVSGTLGDRVQYDNQGRPVITYEQMLALRAKDVQVNTYALRVYRPKLGPNKTWLIPANLYLKWYGLEYVCAGDTEGIETLERKLGIKRRPVLKTPAVVVHEPSQMAPEVKVFFCNEKYPDCARFFDTQKGLEFHWKSAAHEGKVTGKHRTVSAAGVASED